MPPAYDYIVISTKAVGDAVLEATLRANIFTEEAGKLWISELEDIGKLNYRCLRTYAPGPKLVFKKDFRCHHNTNASLPSRNTKTPHAKHTNCHAMLRITIKKTSMKRSKDPHLKTHPTEIFIRNDHNHLIQCADVMRHRRPNAVTEEKVKKLFESGHSPSSAIEVIKFDLQEEYGSQYFTVAADGALCPSMQWMYYFYYITYRKKYGQPEGKEMLNSLTEFIESYNKECGSVCAKMEFDENNKELIVAICSPIMKRTHENLRSTAEIMFMDASGCMDRHNSRVFTLLAPSIAGALPVGLLILFSESENSITKGLKLFQSILPERAFFGNGAPKIVMTDDSTSERNSLKNVFPCVVLLLCRFHILQALWRFLLNSKNGVKENDRPQIFDLFKQTFYCKTIKEVDEKFAEILNNAIVKKYPSVVEYLQKLISRAEEWCPAYISHFITRGHTTNNISEANFRIIKDKIMERLKAFSVVQLFDFLTTRYEAFFERRLADFLSNRSCSQIRRRYLVPEEKVKNLEVTKFSEDIYLVTNLEKKTKYEVNSLLQVCSCPVGCQGAACKHQLAVVLKYNLYNDQLILKNDSQACHLGVP